MDLKYVFIAVILIVWIYKSPIFHIPLHLDASRQKIVTPLWFYSCSKKCLLHRRRPPTIARGGAYRPRQPRRGIGDFGQPSGLQFDRHLIGRQQSQKVAIEQNLPDCYNRSAFDGHIDWWHADIGEHFIHLHA